MLTEKKSRDEFVRYIECKMCGTREVISIYNREQYAEHRRKAGRARLIKKHNKKINDV